MRYRKRLNRDLIIEERECQIVTIPLVEMKIVGKNNAKVPGRDPLNCHTPPKEVELSGVKIEESHRTGNW